MSEREEVLNKLAGYEYPEWCNWVSIDGDVGTLIDAYIAHFSGFFHYPMVIFGLPGGFFGSLALAKLSDKLAKKNIKYRIYFIVFSIVTLFGLYILIFYLPLPNLTIEEGTNLAIVFSLPGIWVIGMFAFIARAVVGIWNINQPPILQAINLPEAQGTVSSANQFLEYIGSGTGPILAGFLLIYFNQNYQITVTLTMGIGIFGGVLWFLATKWINKDTERISDILKERGIELSKKNKESKI